MSALNVPVLETLIEHHLELSLRQCDLKPNELIVFGELEVEPEDNSEPIRVYAIDKVEAPETFKRLVLIEAYRLVLELQASYWYRVNRNVTSLNLFSLQ